MITTDIFNLERGNAQGDTISPYLFNLGYQILLFKLELSLQIKGVLEDFESLAIANLRRARPNDPVITVRPTDPKAFALADDCTLVIKMEHNNLVTVLRILEQFEKISGLGCNVEKTTLMQIGSNDPIPDDIVNLGFTIDNKIILLGAIIDNSAICYERNYDKLLEKLTKTVNFWKRFNLSLPGRINVTKTFLYSQLNYLGCFMPFTTKITKDMSTIIEQFVSGNIKLGKN